MKNKVADRQKHELALKKQCSRRKSLKIFKKVDCEKPYGALKFTPLQQLSARLEISKKAGWKKQPDLKKYLGDPINYLCD